MNKTIFLIRMIPIAYIFLMLAPAAKSQNTANNPAMLTFGQGGGISGKYTEYSLSVDRNLVRINLETGETICIKRIRKKLCKRLFNEAETLGLMRMEFNHPFNMNYYVIYGKGTRENKVNWGDARKPPPPGVQEFWDKLWALVK